MVKIFLGEISSYKAIVIAKYLSCRYKNILIYTYNNNKATSLLNSKYSHKNFSLPISSIGDYLKSISEIISKEDIDFFFPVHSDYIGEILKQKEIFGNTLDYLGDFEWYEKLHDKKSLQKIAATLNISIPINYDNFESAEIPYIAKPILGSSAKGVMYFTSKADNVKKDEITLKDYLFQEYIDGIGCGYSVYAKKGEIIKGYGHLRLAEFPITGGSSIYRESFYTDKMKDIAVKILKAIPWTGFAMFEFKIKSNGELVLIEVNPRIWGSINQGLQNGINYFESILGKPTKIVDNTKQETKTYLSPQIYLSLFFYLLKGNLKPTIKFLKNIKVNKADVSIFDDPRGWLSIILRKIL